MKLAPVIAQLQGIPGIKTVEDVFTLADLATVQVALPALFVVPAARTAGQTQEGAGLIDVETTVTFDVVILVNAAATRGKNRDELETISEAVTKRLLGFTPGPEFRPFIPVSARLLGAAGGRVSWVQRFRTVTHERKVG